MYFFSWKYGGWTGMKVEVWLRSLKEINGSSDYVRVYERV